MLGVYREVVPPERAVGTEVMEFEIAGEPRTGEQLTTLTLTEQGNKTHLALTLLYKSREDRDAALASGMEQGVAASYDRLDAILSSAMPGKTQSA